MDPRNTLNFQHVVNCLYNSIDHGFDFGWDSGDGCLVRWGMAYREAVKVADAWRKGKRHIAKGDWADGMFVEVERLNAEYYRNK